MKGNLMEKPKLGELLEAGVHFGHRSSRWNPKMKKFIYTEKGGIHIIDLEKTIGLLSEAENFIAKEAAEGKTILFVGTKKQAVEIVKQAAETAGMPFVTERWPGGLLTNFDTIKHSIKKMVSMREMLENGEYEKLSKKEQSVFKNKLNRKESLFSGLADLKKRPEIVFMIDLPSQKIAVKECREIDLPIVALVDTNANPDLVSWPIPANDDATKSIEYLTDRIAKAIIEGKKQASKNEKENPKVT
jgi:small subunit ribosomal protein S2